MPWQRSQRQLLEVVGHTVVKRQQGFLARQTAT
jgi:hypothetical protein